MQYLALTTIIWAFSFGIIGSTLKGLDLLQVADTRLWLAFLVFLPWQKFAPTSALEKVQLIILGAVQFGLMYTCYLSAFNYIPSHLVALFSIMTPIYVVIINNLKHRQWSAWPLLAALLSVAGAAVIKTQSLGADNLWRGFLLMQIANLAFALGQVWYRDWKLARPHLKDVNLFAYLYLGAAIMTSIATLLISERSPIPLEANLNQWLAMVYLGIVASGLGFFFWNKGATKTSVAMLATFNNAVVPLAMFASLFIFGEANNSTPEQLTRLAVGAALIASALAIAKYKQAN
ncbi:EamA family transporter [Gayadomonas joobiniege]|uniref:EamA family transporter n=1 Tax=Gayadomonas joobiniege TaxID=1234606 RepID=UPI0003757AB8|nr:EamA family transporter [Gayadomonas joobiniege]